MTKFKKGNTIGKGRPKGALNKFTQSTREAFQYAFDCLGGVEHLTAWAKRHPGDFYRLYARLIPNDFKNYEQTPKKIEFIVIYGKKNMMKKKLQRQILKLWIKVDWNFYCLHIDCFVS